MSLWYVCTYINGCECVYRSKAEVRYFPGFLTKSFIKENLIEPQALRLTYYIWSQLSWHHLSPPQCFNSLQAHDTCSALTWRFEIGSSVIVLCRKYFMHFVISSHSPKISVKILKYLSQIYIKESLTIEKHEAVMLIMYYGL